ncbi:hypothetical protein F5J12DRAFT_916031 [Pisolithus orientalis]|uniref:uncharacterized protein n=1 Tax=Pisolithus orientalis TaxID=936130 RepID=UPI0022255351|nr:uncharacterized protein F5J12DRAFT_916031 [Pisolithus orientalis]KAI5987406.1 hypothetical protein F5J12DRAFT_916031 [Pisolithus orientalis]
MSVMTFVREMSLSMPTGIRGTAPVEGDGGGAPGVIGGTTTTVRGVVASAATIDAEADVDATGDVEAGSSGSIARGGCSSGLGRLSFTVTSGHSAYGEDQNKKTTY